jgi:Heterokaryon incompatibility protein (HET)
MGRPQKPEGTLFVNEHPLEVTENCLFALNELRRESIAQLKTCTIWVDAICINQKDLNERSQQVALMTKIYGGAKNLIIWLVTETHNSCEAIKIMVGLAEACSEGRFGQWRERFESRPRHLQRLISVASFF